MMVYVVSVIRMGLDSSCDSACWIRKIRLRLNFWFWKWYEHIVAWVMFYYPTVRFSIENMAAKDKRSKKRVDNKKIRHVLSVSKSAFEPFGLSAALILSKLPL